MIHLSLCYFTSNICDKVFKNGPIKIYESQPFKNFE